jgi:hypothetical protein
MPDGMTQILSSGPIGTKVNIAVLGDGFANGADQTIYNNKVNDLLINGLFKNDYYFEDIQAFNIFRVNLISVDSGVGTKTNQHKTQGEYRREDGKLRVIGNSWSIPAVETLCQRCQERAQQKQKCSELE